LMALIEHSIENLPEHPGRPAHCADSRSGTSGAERLLAAGAPVRRTRVTSIDTTARTNSPCCHEVTRRSGPICIGGHSSATHIGSLRTNDRRNLHVPSSTTPCIDSRSCVDRQSATRFCMTTRSCTTRCRAGPCGPTVMRSC
jgi:hypothetical protein